MLPVQSSLAQSGCPTFGSTNAVKRRTGLAAPIHLFELLDNHPGPNNSQKTWASFSFALFIPSCGRFCMVRVMLSLLSFCPHFANGKMKEEGRAVTDIKYKCLSNQKCSFTKKKYHDITASDKGLSSGQLQVPSNL